MLELKVIIVINIVLTIVLLYSIGEILEPLIDVLKKDNEIKEKLLKEMEDEGKR